MGLNCPECGKPSKVFDSRPAEVDGAQAVWRRRRCPDGHRFTSVEVVAGKAENHALLEIRRAHKTIAATRDALSQVVSELEQLSQGGRLKP